MTYEKLMRGQQFIGAPKYDLEHVPINTGVMHAVATIWRHDVYWFAEVQGIVGAGIAESRADAIELVTGRLCTRNPFCTKSLTAAQKGSD
jgi:hypothetical protein